AARTARRASSSCRTGTPKTAKTASPMNFSTRPPWRSSTRCISPPYRVITCWNDSGSSRSPRPVDPTTSEKTIVTVLRTRAPPAGSRLSLRASTWRSYGTGPHGVRYERFPRRGRTSEAMRRYNDHPLLSPSDLNNLLECRHLMALEIARFNGNGVQRSGRGAHVDILARYGEQHETAILESYEKDGRSVERVVTGPGEDRFRAALEQTLAAMRRGVDAIHQATLVGDGFGGYADFLERVARPSALGDWSYEVADAKLARATKGYFLVQLSVYAALLERIQELEPKKLMVLLGDGVRDAYRTDDFAAYVRHIQAYAKEMIGDGLGETYPLPCGHCGICDYRHHCETRRRADDHLSLVAGIRRDQVARLEEDGIKTLALLAGINPDRKVKRIPRDSLTKLRGQAALQLRERETGQRCYELLAYEPRRGFGLLPEPADGDLYFDLEGDPYIGDRGLVYLFGLGWDAGGEERYEPFWAHCSEDEKTAFEALADFIMAWRERHPGCHVYHYGAIEETKLKQLAMLHATRELQVDT